MVTNKYYVLTVQDCSDKIEVFETENQVNDFLNNWLKQYGTFDDQDSFWIRNIYYGQELEFEQKAAIRVPSLTMSEEKIVFNVNTHNQIITTSKGFQFEKTTKGWKDLTSNLTWKFIDESEEYTYGEAVKKFGDSLPTKEDFEKAERHGFREVIELKNDWYWSSSLVSYGRLSAWIFGSTNGYVDLSLRDFPYWVRCVERE